MKSKMVAPINKRRSSLKLVNKETKEVRLVGVVNALHASFGTDRTFIRL